MIWDYLIAIRARWALVAVTALSVLGAIAVWSLFSPRVYSASATLLFDTSQTDPVGDRGGGAKNASLLGTQADIIRSAFVAERVVRDLKLDQPAAVQAQYRAASPGIPLQEWLGRRLAKPLEILPTRNTNVLAVSYKSADPDYAARMATAFAQAYVQTQLQLRIDPARVYSQWFETQIADARRRLETAQRRLTRMQQARGLVGAGRFDIEQSHLTELSAQLSGAEADAAQARARAGSNVGSSSDAQMSGVVQGLDSQIAGRSAQLQQLRQTLGPNHPDVLAAQAELGQLRNSRGQAVGTAVTAVQTASSAASAREANLRGLVAAQRERLLRLSGVQDEFAVLQRDVDTAKAAYDAVTNRLNQVRLQSEIPITNVSLLDRAVAPTIPTSPNVSIRLLLGLLLGLFTGVALALLVEWRSPRIRSVGGLEGATGVAVLADLDRGSPLLNLMHGEARS